MLAGANDPDYRRCGPGLVRRRSGRRDRRRRLVRVGAGRRVSADRPAGMVPARRGSPSSRSIYTLQGAGSTVSSCQFRSTGSRSRRWESARRQRASTALPQHDVLALVSISDPAEGRSSSGSFIAKGGANSFEATVPWQICAAPTATSCSRASPRRRAAMDKLYPWETEIDVSGLRARHLHVRRDDRRPVRRRRGLRRRRTDTRTIVVRVGPPPPPPTREGWMP